MPQFGQLFIAGMMLYRLRTGRQSATTRWALLLAVAYSMLGRDDWAAVPPLVYFVANAAFVAAVWAAAAGRAPLLASRPLVALGAARLSWRWVEQSAQLAGSQTKIGMSRLVRLR